MNQEEKTFFVQLEMERGQMNFDLAPFDVVYFCEFSRSRGENLRCCRVTWLDARLT